MSTKSMEVAEYERRINELRTSVGHPEMHGYTLWKQIMISVLTNMLKRSKP